MIEKSNDLAIVQSFSEFLANSIKMNVKEKAWILENLPKNLSGLSSIILSIVPGNSALKTFLKFNGSIFKSGSLKILTQ